MARISGQFATLVQQPAAFLFLIDALPANRPSVFPIPKNARESHSRTPGGRSLSGHGGRDASFHISTHVYKRQLFHG